MNRLAGKVLMPLEVKQISDYLMDAEGTCTCGRVLRKLDPKLILMTAAPSVGMLLVGAYCLMCSQSINRILKSLRNITYTGTETAPVGPIKKL